MTARATIEAALYTWVSQATGVTTIFAHQAEPRPQTPYAVIQISTIASLGGDEPRSWSEQSR